MKNPPSGDQGLAFQTHALQMTLFGPFHVRTQNCWVRYEPCPYKDILVSKKIKPKQEILLLRWHLVRGNQHYF